MRSFTLARFSFPLMLCLAGAGAQKAAATEVIVTITGTVQYGIDQTGVFGPPEMDLTGKAFKLVYSFDDTKVPSTIAYCSGIPCESMAIGSGASSPGTAVLTIGSGSFRFGTFGGGAYASGEVEQSASSTFSSMYYEAGDYTYGFSDSVQMSIASPDGAPPMTTNYDWRGSFFFNSQFSSGSGAHFGITQNTEIGPGISVGGGLTPTSISVVGIGPPPAVNALLTMVNPFSQYAILGLAPPAVDVPTVLISPPATSVAADGKSAAVIVYRSKSSQPVQFNISASGPVPPSNTAAGSLGQYDANFLKSPSPVQSNAQSYPVNTPAAGPDAAGVYTFLALLWAPSSMPAGISFPVVTVAVTATQRQATSSPASIEIQPPPLLLVHGIWSSAWDANFLPGEGGLYDWIVNQYPHKLVSAVDYGNPNSVYGNLSAKAFDDPAIQSILLSSLTSSLGSAAGAGMAARTVDVFGHSMGGLVTRYFMTSGPASPSPQLLPNSVHTLVTVGTPHQGTDLATALVANQNTVSPFTLTISPWLTISCVSLSSCTLGDAMTNLLHRPIDSGVQSLEPQSPQLQSLSSSNVFDAITGTAPTFSATELLLNLLITVFLPGQSVDSILKNQPNDTLVTTTSQAGGENQCMTPQPAQPCSAPISGIVHTDIAGTDIGETASPQVWDAALYWLAGVGSVPTSSSNAQRKAVPAAVTAAPQPVLDLTGYTQVPGSNVTILPATGATLTIGSATNITGTSSKTITEVLLFQTVTDPSDAALLYSTQAPFSIPFTPTRLGSASFTAVTVFSDKTYATTALNYTLQPAGNPASLTLVNAPAANLNVGSSQVVGAEAWFTAGPVDVSQAAKYSVRSGTANVFSVSAGGAITAKGSGVDLLDVSYGGLTATAQIAAGACTYAIAPSNQLVPNVGGTITIQVATQSGCSWIASGGAAWLPFTQASGNGPGAITLAAAANTAGTQTAIVTVAGLQALVTQAGIACKYALSSSQINAPPAGITGTINVTSSCPVIASSDHSWLTPAAAASSVTYAIAPNNSASQRTATLTIGTAAVSVTQAGGTSSITSVSTASGGPDIAQNTFIVIKGANLVPAATPAEGAIWSTAPSFNAGQMPTQLSGVSVTVNGKPAYIYFFCSAATSAVCASDQINVLTPLDSATGPVQIIVSSGATVSTPFSVSMKTVSPALLLFGGNYVAATHANGGLIGPASLYPGSSTPAQPGEEVVLYGVGFGLPSTSLTAGSALQSGTLPALPTCSIGAKPASVAFAGLIGPGLYQVNVIIPTTVPSGDNMIGCAYGGSATPAGDVITIGEPN